MRTFVWVDAWQLQCCGDRFTVGSAVRWNVLPADDKWVEQLLGTEWAQRVELREEHHGETGTELIGRVESIGVVTCQRTLADSPTGGPGGQVYMPVRGSGTIRAAQESDPWEPEAHPFVTFDGWIVEVDSG